MFVLKRLSNLTASECIIFAQKNVFVLSSTSKKVTLDWPRPLSSQTNFITGNYYLKPKFLKKIGTKLLTSSVQYIGETDESDNTENAIDNDEEEEEEEDFNDGYAEREERKMIDSEQCVLLLHPRVVGGKNGPETRHTTDELMAAEAETLVATLPKWRVKRTILVRTNKSTKKLHVWGTTKLMELRDIVQRESVTAVFVNAARLNPAQQSQLFDVFQVPVFDRFTIVLLIFKTYAKTPEAHLQIRIAEIPYLSERLDFLVHAAGSPDGVNLQSRMNEWSHCGYVQPDILKKQESRLKKKLAIVMAKKKSERDLRNLASSQKRSMPTIAVIGYTNAGKTSLIKRVTQDKNMAPEDRLFATLDTTVHKTKLPCLLPVYFADTIGFISNLPHLLIASFQATLDDVRHAQQLVHIRDVSHPDTMCQHNRVLETLKNLKLPPTLLENMIEARNKVDKISDESLVEKMQMEARETKNTVLISCRSGQGLEELIQLIQRRVLETTGHKARRLKLAAGSDAYTFVISQTAILSHPEPSQCGHYLFVHAVMSDAQFAKFQSRFGRVVKKKF